MHYDNQYTAGYMEEQANLEVANLKFEVEELNKRIKELEAFIVKLESHLEFIEKLP